MLRAGVVYLDYPHLMDRPKPFPYTTAHLEYVPNAKLTIVFSCPGNTEADLEMPAAGTTGKNLEFLLGELCKFKGCEDFYRSRVTITNAWHQPESDQLTGKSEAQESEILTYRNLNRLKREVGSPRLLIASGKMAHVAVLAAIGPEFRGTILLIPHIGGRGIQRLGSPTNKALCELARWIARNCTKRIAYYWEYKRRKAK